MAYRISGLNQTNDSLVHAHDCSTVVLAYLFFCHRIVLAVEKGYYFRPKQCFQLAPMAIPLTSANTGVARIFDWVGGGGQTSNHMQ